MLTVKAQSYIFYINFLFLLSLPSVSNFNSPFENSWPKRLKNFLQRPAFLLLSQVFNSELSGKFDFTLTFFGKITSYIIQFSHAFLLRRSSQVKLLKLSIYSIFQTAKHLWGDNQLFPCRSSDLTICLCLPNHYDLKVHFMNWQFSLDAPCD